MSFLDKVKSFLGSPAAAGRSRTLEGPLGLQPGHRVTYYREAYFVTGIRQLSREGRPIAFQYCLQTSEGQRAVLVAETGDEPALSMQKAHVGEVDWSQDRIVGEEEDHHYELRSSGSADVTAVGDTGFRAPAACTFRYFEDPDGEQMLVFEDYGHHQEYRSGDPVFEAELEIDTGENSASPLWVDANPDLADEPPADPSADPDDRPAAPKGSPQAAAEMLTAEIVLDEQPAVSSADYDPTAYDDEGWADAYDPDDEVNEALDDSWSTEGTPVGAAASDEDDDEEEDEWLS